MSAVDRFLVIFPSIVYEALPFIILGALISGTLEELLPQQTIARLIPRRRSLAIAGSALLGLIFPMCECGIVPVMRRLLGKGLPLACAVAYMLAAPVINPVVIASTWAAFSGNRDQLDGLTSYQMVGLRVGLAFITAFLAGMVVSRRERSLGLDALIKPIQGSAARPTALKNHPVHEHGPSCEHGHDHDHGNDHHAEEPAPATAGVSLKVLAPAAAPVHGLTGEPELQKKNVVQRLMSISETALHDFIDITCFLILGAFLASLVQTFGLMRIAPELGQNVWLAVPAMMLLAVLLCLCSEADAFVAANLIQIPLGGKLAFLVLGPMLDLKLYMMYTRVFRTKLIWTIIPTVVISVFILSLAAHYLDLAFQPPPPPASTSP